MIIAKNLSRLFIALLITAMITTHQLHAMKMEFIDPTTMDAEFQTYKLLSAIDNNHQCYLLPELVQTIATNVSKLIDKDCYEGYGTCLKNSTELLNFIERNLLNKSMNHISTVNIIKRCLRYSGKSLSEIKDDKYKTIFVRSIDRIAENDIHIGCIKTLKLVAENEAWNIICMQDINGFTILTWAAPLDPSVISELFSSAPNSQAVWDLIITPDTYGGTAFGWTRDCRNTGLIQLFESYRPKEQQTNTFVCQS